MNNSSPTDEIIELDAVRELKSLSEKIDDASNFMKSVHSKEEKKMFRAVLDRLRLETQNQLTETEYANLARMVFWCDRFESLFAGITPDQIDKDLYNQYRMTLAQVTDAMRAFREKSKSAPSTIKEIKNIIINMRTDDKYKLKDAVESEEIIIIEEEK